MSRLQQVVLALFVASGLCVVTTIAVASVYVVRDGIVTVSVDEKTGDGAHFTLPVPGSAFRLAMFVADHALSEHDRRALRREIQNGMRQVPTGVDALVRELRNCPDMTLVEIEGRDERVTIQKRGGTLTIRVDDSQANVRITVPTAMLTMAFESLRAVSG